MSAVEPMKVCAGVILKSGMVMLARRAPGKRHAGKWEFPGGRIEAGETVEAALARELREEFGIEATVGAEAGRNRHTYDTVEIELIAHLVTKFTGELKPVDHDRIAWVEAKKLLEYDLVAADIPIAQVVASHKRRGRYDGTHPKTFTDKYKELAGDQQAVEKAKARGSTPAGRHLPIMLKEIVAALSPLKGARVVDCTLGWGGHTEALAREGADVLGLDRDGEELRRTAERLKAAGVTVRTRHTDYAHALEAVKAEGWDGADAVLADLGVSSMQLDRPERGMSFKNDGPLDMRMDRSKGQTAAQWLESATQRQIELALKKYGDEPEAERIAAALFRLKQEGKSPRTTHELVAAIGAAGFKKKDAFSAHPAARTFQALRIAVNAERESLWLLLRELPAMLKPGGRVAILTFHSGEEALVESALREQSTQEIWEDVAAPAKAAAEEVRENPRARSARLWRARRA